MDWLFSEANHLWILTVKTIIFYFGIIIYSRILGLRSFAKMSTFDFAMTVAIGSMMASVALSPNTALIQALVSLAVLYSLQFVVSQFRIKKSNTVNTAVDNSPLLLMEGNSIDEGNLHQAGMTKGDLFAKVRLAGVTDLSNVYAVVMETTGDVSVMHGNTEEEPFDYNLLYGVRDNKQVPKNGSFDVEHLHDDTEPSL